jgi:hypothetical protein
MARLAPSLAAMRSEANRLYPNRDKRSDGWIADTAHAPSSDHQPDSRGIVHALDLDEDLDGTDVNNGAELMFLAEHIRMSRDRRVKYVIYEGRIFAGNEGPQPWVWRPYSGASPHDKHMHTSVLSTQVGENDTSPWFPQDVVINPPPHTPRKRRMTTLHCIRNGANGGVYRIGVGAPYHIPSGIELQDLVNAEVPMINYGEASAAENHLRQATEEWNDKKALVLYVAALHNEVVEIGDDVDDVETLLAKLDIPPQ